MLEKKVTFWIERLIINSAEELGFMETRFQWEVLKPNPASVPQTELNLGDTVLGEVEKNSFIAPRQRGPQWANALRTVCPNLEEVVRS